VPMLVCLTSADYLPVIIIQSDFLTASKVGSSLPFGCTFFCFWSHHRILHQDLCSMFASMLRQYWWVLISPVIQFCNPVKKLEWPIGQKLLPNPVKGTHLYIL
jgi:hypothetical protein